MLNLGGVDASMRLNHNKQGHSEDEAKRGMQGSRGQKKRVKR